MSEQLFNPAAILPIPGKRNKSQDNNMREAVKNKPNHEVIPEQIPIEIPAETIPLAESTVETIILPSESTVEGMSLPSTSDIKKLVLTKSKDKIKMGYIVDRKTVRYIDEISSELKYGEIQNRHPSIIADEFLKIGQLFCERYRQKLVETIAGGDQISEFIFREFHKEFNILEDE